MAYQEILSAKPKRRRNQKPCASLYTTESRRASYLVDVRIRLTRPLMEILGWTPNERVSVLVGTDEHQGTIMLRHDPEGPFEFRPSTQSLSSSVLSSRNIPLPAGLKTKMEWTKIEGGVLLKIG